VTRVVAERAPGALQEERGAEEAAGEDLERLAAARRGRKLARRRIEPARFHAHF
jgi:hypothetical protein